MKSKTLLALAVAAAAQQSAFADTAWVPVSSTAEITDGGKYVIAGYNNQWTNPVKVLYYDSEADNVAAISLPNASPAAFDAALQSIGHANAEWTLTAIADSSCGNHSAEIVFNANINGKYAVFHTSGFATTETVNTTGTEDGNKLHFSAATSPAGIHSGTIFNLKHSLSGSSCAKTLAINDDATNVFGFSSTEAGSLNTITSTWTYVVRIYKVEEKTADEIQAARQEKLTALKGTISQTIEQYINSISGITCDATIATDARNSIDNVTLSAGATDLDLFAEEDALNAAYPDATAKVISNIFGQLDGKYVKVKNANNNLLLSAEASGISQNATFGLPQILLVEKSGETEGNFTLMSPFTQLYLGSATENSWIATTQTKDDAATFTLSPVATSSACRFSLQASAVSGSNALNSNLVNGNRVIYWSANDIASQWYISVISDEETTNTRTAVNNFINECVNGTEAQLAHLGTGLGEYSRSSEDSEAAKTAILAAINSDLGTLGAAYAANAAQLENCALRINQPRPGSYIRIKTAPKHVEATSAFTAAPYLTCYNNGDTNIENAKFATDLSSDESKLNTILYYTGENLLGYANGRYARGAKMLYFNNDTEGIESNTGANVTFIEGYDEPGTYSVNYSTNRYLYTGTGFYTNGGTANTAAGYNFELEYVDELPVTIDSNGNGTATFQVPVAVTIPNVEGVEFYVSKLIDDVLIIHQAKAGDTFAANTGIMLKGTADAIVNFTIAAADAQDIDKEYAGTFAAQHAAGALVNAAGKKTYASVATSATSAAPQRIAAKIPEYPTISFSEQAEGTVLPVNTALLQLSESDSRGTALQIPLVFDSQNDYQFDTETGETSIPEYTGITTVVVEKADGSDEIFDLQGRRVNTLRHGIYIVNGAKIRM